MSTWIYFLLVLLTMTAWCVLHSYLAALSTKQLVRRFTSQRVDRFYRLAFVGIAVGTLLPVLELVVRAPAVTLWTIPMPWRIISLSIQGLALIGLILAVLQTDGLAFVGLRQVIETSQPPAESLVTDGFYRFVRHPFYFFSLIIFWLFPIMTNLTLAFFLVATLYFFIGSILEERKLIKVYGAAYQTYRQEVPRIIPRFPRRRR